MPPIRNAPSSSTETARRFVASGQLAENAMTRTPRQLVSPDQTTRPATTDVGSTQSVMDAPGSQGVAVRDPSSPSRDTALAAIASPRHKAGTSIYAVPDAPERARTESPASPDPDWNRDRRTTRTTTPASGCASAARRTTIDTTPDARESESLAAGVETVAAPLALRRASATGRGAPRPSSDRTRCAGATLCEAARNSAITVTRASATTTAPTIRTVRREPTDPTTTKWPSLPAGPSPSSRSC